MAKQIFLVRHADYSGGGPDPEISEQGKYDALKLAKNIKAALLPGSVTIWSSSANRAVGTAQIVKEEMQLAEMVIEEKLWSDNKHPQDFPWLKGKIEDFEGDVLIIVSHLEYVRQFPQMLGFRSNDAGYTSGVKIENGQCTDFR